MDLLQGMLRTLLHIYSNIDGKADTDHMSDVYFIRVKQQVGEVRAFAVYNTTTLYVLNKWHGRSKLAIKLLKDQDRRDCNLSTQGCKRGRGETGEGSALDRTDGVDEDMKITTYKTPGDTLNNQLMRPFIRPTTTIKPDVDLQQEIPSLRVTLKRNPPIKTEDRQCLKSVKKVIWKRHALPTFVLILKSSEPRTYRKFQKTCVHVPTWKSSMNMA